MDTPRIRYAKTSDGVSIAFFAAGDGPILVQTPPWPYAWTPSLSAGDVVLDDVADWLGEVTVVRYDCRGQGMSDRNVSAFSLDALVLDLAAVVEKVASGPVHLMSSFTLTPVAIRFAAHHPEMVSKLVLWCGYSHGDELDTDEWNGFVSLAERDWEMAYRTLPQANADWMPSDRVRQQAEVLNRSITQETYLEFVSQIRNWDARRDLPNVTADTLVMSRREFRYFKLELSKRIAAAIPNSQLLECEGGSGSIDPDQQMTLLGFLRGDERRRAIPPPTPIRTVLFTDLVGHTEMMSRLGDERGREVLREHERITREVLKANGGTEVKTMGDGFMASFGSVTKAVECAVALQRAFAHWNTASGRDVPAERLSVRVGLNAGEPIEEDGDLFGATVILASRIAAKAEGGEILVADTVRGLCSGKGFLFSDRGEFVAKGFEEPVRVYEVRWR